MGTVATEDATIGFTTIKTLAPISTATSRCATWPAPDRVDPPAGNAPVFPDVPTLVLAGDLDTLTPPSEGEAAAALFPGATFVTVANTGHVTALDDSWGCASVIVTDFIAAGKVGDTTCASSIPEIRTVDRFPVHAVGATAATAAPGDASTDADRQIAAVAVGQVGDSLAQWGVMTGNDGAGMRGGTFTVDDGDTLTVSFNGAKLADDVSVDGTATIDQTTGKVDASLDVTSGTTTGTIVASWNASDVEASATARGTLDGRPVSVTMPAP